MRHMICPIWYTTNVSCKIAFRSVLRSPKFSSITAIFRVICEVYGLDLKYTVLELKVYGLCTKIYGLQKYTVLENWKYTVFMRKLYGLFHEIIRSSKMVSKHFVKDGTVYVKDRIFYAHTVYFQARTVYFTFQDHIWTIFHDRCLSCV